jgi:hypothetical protein
MVTGEAFVALESAKDQERALERHKQTLGERWVEEPGEEQGAGDVLELPA